MSELTVTHTSTVTEDQIDHLGHMNVRFYASNAHRGTRALMGSLGIRRHENLVIDDTYTRHHREQLLGSRLEVRSGLLSHGDGSIQIYHELANADTDELAATFVHRLAIDEPIPASAVTIDIPARGATRSIDLTADPVGSAPSLDAVRELNLEMRRVRAIGDLECEESNTVLPHMIVYLIWGGETLDGTEQVFNHVGPNGENIAWATMETRISIARLPERGTRVQSFAATTNIADKTTKMAMWCYDVDRGELLVAFELVNLMFNIDERRPMQIPPNMVAFERSRLHPELAPR